MWSDFGVEVVNERISFTNLSEVLNYVKRLAKDMHGDFKVLLINLTNVDPEKLGRILYEADVLKSDLRSKNVTLMLNTELKTKGGPVEVEVRPGEDVIETIERSVAENLAKKLGSSVTSDKVLDLINILSRKKPEGSSEDEFYEEMFKELMKVLEAVFGESGRLVDVLNEVINDLKQDYLSSKSDELVRIRDQVLKSYYEVREMGSSNESLL